MKEKFRESSFTDHWIRIKLEGFRPEKVISEAAGRGIRIRHISYRDETELYMTVSAGGLRQLEKNLRNRYKITILREGGSTPALRKLKKRKLMIAGILVFAAFFAVQSMFVKEVQIVGSNMIPEQEIRQCIREEGLYEGALRNFDCQKIESKLFKTFDEIVWSRVAYDGGFVRVEIAENTVTDTSEGEKKKKPCDIVADCDGYIEKVIAYKGRSRVSPDESVKKGEVLITGTIPIEDTAYEEKKEKENYEYVHADGKIAARVPYYYSINVTSDTDRKGAEAAVREWIKENIPENAQILNKSLNFTEKKNIIRIYGIIETRRLIGEEKEILIDKHERRTEKSRN